MRIKKSALDKLPKNMTIMKLCKLLGISNPTFFSKQKNGWRRIEIEGAYNIICSVVEIDRDDFFE